MTGPIAGDVVVHYEALRPGGAGGPTGTTAGRSLVQRCGVTAWAQTCSAICPATTSIAGPPSGPGLIPREPGTGLRAVSLPPGVRDQVARLLASMIVHRCGGDHGFSRPGAARAAIAAGLA
jgi:hypothetical protein